MRSSTTPLDLSDISGSLLVLFQLDVAVRLAVAITALSDRGEPVTLAAIADLFDSAADDTAANQVLRLPNGLQKLPAILRELASDRATAERVAAALADNPHAIDRIAAAAVEFGAAA